MYRALEPCIRCGGKGTVPIFCLEVFPETEDYNPAMKTAKCHGCGGTGKVPSKAKGDSNARTGREAGHLPAGDF